MEDAKISVIVPVYKVEKYLDRCVESIVNQTYKNLEIILVDDGSPDDCPAMCDAWAKKDERIQVIHKENGGVSSARNRGIDAATGDYIGFVDSDDWIDHDMYEALIGALENTGSDVAMCGFYFEAFSQTLCSEGCDCIVDKENILKTYILDKIRPELWNKLFSIDLFVENIRLDEKYQYAEDLLFNYYLLKNAKRVVGIKDCKYHYLQNSGNSSTTAYMTDARATSWNVTKIIADDQRENQELYPICIWRHIRTLFAILSRVVNGEDKSFCDKYFDDIIQEILTYKNIILKDKRFSIKYKIAVVLIMVSPRLYLKVNRSILNRG